MSLLKPTRCETFCKFTQITAYCFDCPALMCTHCKDVMHNGVLNNEKHCILDFKNECLNWNDKSIILSVFDDKNLGEIIYGEVSRKLENEKKSNSFEEIESEQILYTDPIDSWQCKSCTFFNAKHRSKCEMCCLINIPDENCNDCDFKLSKFQLEKFKDFQDLEKIQSDNVNINFEHIMHCYNSDCSFDCDLNKSIIDWLMQYYFDGKNLAIMDSILKGNHRITLNELNKRYADIVKSENDKIINKLKNKIVLTDLLKTVELIEPEKINLINKIPDMSQITVTEDDVWNIIINQVPYSPRIIRLLMVELELDLNSRVDMLQIFICDDKLGNYLKNSQTRRTVNLSHVKQAICDQVSIEGASYFLMKQCEICCDEFPMPEMCQFIICQHEFCKSCVFEWLKQEVENSYPCNWTCPNCDKEKYKLVDKNMHYSQLKNILITDSTLLHIFEEKLLQEQIMTSQNFHWCPMEECTNGFESEGLIKITCPTCHSYLCANCGRKWHNEHEGKTCLEFEMWMLKNDPNLSKLLQNIGIECPGCGMRYAMAPGGCLHFDCKACGVQFCGGCDQLFVMKCDKPKCEMTNFHGHHPRNCFYFLRDRNAEELEQMLKNSEYPILQGKPQKECQFMITTDKLKDVPCNKECYRTTGLCEAHYKEYLVQFINRYKIDPADFADTNSLNMMLFQMVLPKLTKLAKENDNQFKERLIKEVKDTCLFYIPKGTIDPA